MRLTKWLAILCFAALPAMWCPEAARSADSESGGAKVEQPDAKKTVSNVATHLSKLTDKKSYNVTCDVWGGKSKTADHAVPIPNMGFKFSGDIQRGVMKVITEEAYRTIEKGAFRDRRTNGWQDIFAHKEGKEVAHLFPFPAELLRRSLEKAQNIEWIATASMTEAPAKAGAAPQPSAPEGTTEAPKPGTTRVDPKTGGAQGGSGTAGGEAGTIEGPRVARIQLDRIAAESFWYDIKHSGFFDPNGCSGVSDFLILVDASYTEGWLDVHLEPDLVTPKRMELLILTGLKEAGDTVDGKRDFAKEPHLAFTFKLELGAWDAVDRFVVPVDAQKLLR